MKNQNPMHALLAAFVLLVGISSTDAALCSASEFAVASLPTCDCPLGTGVSGSFDSALPPKVGGYGAAAGTVATGAEQLAAANLALLLCEDMLPGYTTVTGTATPTKCAQAGATGSYCTGFPDLYKVGGNAGKIVVTAEANVKGTDALGYGTPVLAASYTVVGGTAVEDATIRSCPTNSLSSGTTGLMTIERCKVTNGFYVSAVDSTTKVRTIIVSPIGFTATPDCNGADDETTCVSVTCIGGGNTDNVVGGFVCPAQTYGTKGASIALSIAALTGETLCPAGTTPDGAAKICEPTIDGYYGAPGNVLSCPIGVTGTAGLTLAGSCTAVAPGYYIPTAIPKQSIAGNLDALAAGILPCPLNKHCAGKASAIAIVGKSQSFATYAAVAKSTGGALPIACPAGIGNAQTVSAQGANAVSEPKACVDLLPGYSFTADASGTDVDAVGSIITKCSDSVTSEYGCAGSASLFVDYSAATKTIAAGTGLSSSSAWTTQLVLSGSSALTGSITVAAEGGGSLVRSSCPAGSTNTVDSGPITGCLLIPGYYVDESDLLVGVACPTGVYCPGGGPIATAGGIVACPHGSVGPVGSSFKNSAIGDCTLSDGFYIASAAVNVPVPCLTANICAGGGPVGIAGGSVACPTGSTNTACSDTASTTVNLTPSSPVTVDVAAPTVAVTTPDVTVSNTVPSASSASSTAASLVLIAAATMVAL